MRKLLLCFSVILLPGCVTTTPQTREDFKTWTKEHTSMGLYEVYTVNRSFEDVVASLQKKWLQCYDINATTRRVSGGITTSNYTDTFHPKFKKVDKSHLEMTLQMTTKGMIMLNKTPEGGEYVIALDVQRLSKNKTNLIWYSYSWGKKDELERTKAWGSGKDAPCPD
jgi:hypothetical protein